VNDQFFVLALIVVVMVATSLLVWFAIDIGTDTMARYRATFTEKARFQAQEFFLFIDPHKLFFINLTVMVIVTLGVWLITQSLLVALTMLVVLIAMPRFIYKWMKHKRLLTFEEQLPDALMMLSGALRAGLGINTALVQVTSESPAPLGQEFSLMLREQRLGLSLDQSLGNLARRVPTPTTALVVSAMKIANETGGGLAETLERTAHTIRSRLQMEGKIRALTSQGKLQAWVVGALPLFLMMVLNTMEPEKMALLWTTRIGWGALIIIAVMEVTGIVLIRKIVSIDV
jgi:tight adherence protein B